MSWHTSPAPRAQGDGTGQEFTYSPGSPFSEARLPEPAGEKGAGSSLRRASPKTAPQEQEEPHERGSHGAAGRAQGPSVRRTGHLRAPPAPRRGGDRGGLDPGRPLRLRRLLPARRPLRPVRDPGRLEAPPALPPGARGPTVERPPGGRRRGRGG